MRPLVKVCGVTRLEDAMLASRLGAAAIGFIFWPGSPRFISPPEARAIASRLPPFVATVGVFVDQSPADVRDTADLVKLSAVQLHGHEAPDDYAGAGLRIIKAVGVTDDFDATSVCGLPESVTLLLDAHDPVRRGGTGRTVNWTLAADMARRRRVILSGGLTPVNIAAALEHVRPYAADVSSGVESSPGIKDPDKLAALFAAVFDAAGATSIDRP